MKKVFQWFLNLEKSMGDALFHPYQDNQPPSIGFQPFTGTKSRNKKIFA